MRTKDEIKLEIFELAQKISRASSQKFLLETTREIYEKAILLKHANGEDEPVIVKERAVPEVTAETLVKNEEQPAKQATIDLFSIEEPTQAETAPSAIPDPVTEPVAEKPVMKEQKKPKQIAEESMVEKLQHKRIADLKAAIGINEKFQFINELFDGNMKEYNVAVDQVNNFSSQSEAESYLSNLREMYKWDPENAIALNFQELVERRFT